MKRMFAPDDPDKPFMARWKLLTRILLASPSVKHVAHVAVEYADFNDGTSCFPSNERIAREVGCDEKTVRFAWSVLRGVGMARRVGRAVPHQGIADEYELEIPGNWSSLPILGPHNRKFTCLNCGKLINPEGNCSVNSAKGDKPGSDIVRWDVGRMTFCPSPRRKKGREAVDCREAWSRGQAKVGAPVWHMLGQDVWKKLAESRADDW